MSEPLRILVIEDSEDDAFLEIEALKPIEPNPLWKRVESSGQLLGALDEGPWDLVFSDFTLPSLDGFESLEIVRQRDGDVPFLLISGTVGEEIAAEAMRRGANDFILKGRLVRLLPVVERELRDSHGRRERRKTEAALRESEHRYRSLVEHAIEGIVIGSTNGEILDANPSALAMTGYGREELLARRLDELLVKRDPLPALGRERSTARQRVLRKDGSVFVADISMTTLDGDRLLLIIRDVSRQVEAEELILYRERLHRGLVELGREVAADTAKETLLQSAATLAAESLDMDICRIIEMTEDGPVILGKAGCPVTGTGCCEYTNHSFTRIAASPGPVRIEAEEGSPLQECLRRNEIVTSYGIEVGASAGPVLIMDLHSCSPRELTPDETSFLQSIATLLSSALGQKQAEEALRSSEQRLRSLINSASDAILTLDMDGKITEVNPAWSRMVGRSADALLGRPLTESVEPDRVRELQQALDAVMRTGQPVQIEVPVRSEDGDYMNVEASITGKDRGDNDSLFVIARDVTAQRRAEAEREALMREIELLLASTYEGIYVADASGRCTLVNASAERMLGYERAELLGKDLHQLIHHKRSDGTLYANEDCPILHAARASRQSHISDETFWRRDGTSFPVEIFISPISSDLGELKGVVASFIDVTVQHSLRTELERANRLSDLGRIAATMSHEFNNVLMGIQPFAEVLLRKGTDERVVDAASRIVQSVKRGRRVTEELRRFTRPTPPTRTAIDLASCLRDCAGEIGNILPSNVHFSLELSPDAMNVDADQEQISQVVTNLVINARDAIGPAEGTIVLRAEIANRERQPSFIPDQEERSFVHVSISDDGPGMSSEMQSRIFEPFFTSKKNGTGLGLAITHQIITLHGGRLSVESEPGRGTTMHFFLPVSTAGVKLNATVPVRTEGAMLPDEVLLVEDDEAVAGGLISLLEESGIRVLLAPTGAAALEILEQNVPQVLIIDVGLPDTNGFDLYERIASRMGNLPVVFSSGHADPERMTRLSSACNAVLLTKPYVFDDLIQAMERLRGVAV